MYSYLFVALGVGVRYCLVLFFVRLGSMEFSLEGGGFYFKLWIDLMVVLWMRW